MIYNLVVVLVFATALGAAVTVTLNTIADRLARAFERWSHPAPREEVFHHDCADWYPEDER